MNLYDLADIPNTHLHGPATEREAAAVSAKTRVRNAEIVLAMVRRNPGLTCVELWESATEAEKSQLKDYYEVRRRVNDLAKAVSVRMGDARACRVKGTRMQTVWA